MHDLTDEAAAKRTFRAIRTAILEGADRYRVPADQRRHMRSFDGRRLHLAKRWRIAALRHLDDKIVRLAFFAIVGLQPNAQPTRLHTHNWIHARVEAIAFAEDIDPDGVLLQLITA